MILKEKLSSQIRSNFKIFVFLLNIYLNYHILMIRLKILSMNLQKISEKNPFDIYSLAQLLVNLALRACEVVKECYENVDLKKFDKGGNDPVTEADFKVQTMLTNEVCKRFHGLAIVGEEQVQYKGQIQPIQSSSFIKLPEGANFSKIWNKDDICLWIDPIDNTRGFIGNEIQGVTVLIGLSYKGKSQIGVIGVPYKKLGSKVVYNPSVIIGSAPDKFTFEYIKEQQKWKQLKAPKPNPIPIMVLSPSRKNETQLIIMKQINGEKRLVGGSGHKAVLVAKGEGDLLCYSEPKTKKWDSCAPDAVIKSMGGYFVDFESNQIIYDKESKNYLNKKGILCTFEKKYIQISKQVYNQIVLKK